MDRNILDIADIYEKEIATSVEPKVAINENIFHNIGGALKAGRETFKKNKASREKGQQGKSVFQATAKGFFGTKYKRELNAFKREITKYLLDFENDIQKLGVDLSKYPALQKSVNILRRNIRGEVDLPIDEHVELMAICEGVMSRLQSKAHGYKSGFQQGVSNVAGMFTGNTQNAISSKDRKDVETILKRLQLFITKCKYANDRFMAKFQGVDKTSTGMTRDLYREYKHITDEISTMEQDIKGNLWLNN